MKLLWESSNGWRIYSQPDLVGNDFLCVHRYYPLEKWMPFKSMPTNYTLSCCLCWLAESGFVEWNEIRTKIDLLKQDK